MRTFPMLLVLVAVAAGPAGLIPGAFAQTAAPAPATPPAAATAPAAETLTGLAAWERLKGNTIEGKAGSQTFAEYFNASGEVKYVDKDGPSAGTWAVQNGKVCFDFPEDDDRSCSTFEVSGTTGTARDDDGTTVKFDIIPGNGKGL